MNISLPPDSTKPIAANHRSGFVAVVGRPNVGKSTLMNALLGQKVAIVSPRPQTTRNRISGILTFDDLQVVFVDTPGIHRPEHKLGEFMLAEAMAALPDADLILWVTDLSKPPLADDERVAAALRGQALPAVLVMNKLDITRPADIAKHSESYRALIPNAVADIAISARNAQGLADVIDLLRRFLPPGPRYFPEDQVTDVQMRFLAAELVREQVLLHVREEVPHGVAVEIESFEERANGSAYIAARVLVERDTHKGILLGKGGSMIKQIGSRARQEIETMTEAPVFLDLHVSVRPQWRRSSADLRRLGYAANET